MNNCDDFRELAALHLYGEIGGDELARLERHLAACPTCSDLARELRSGLGRLAPGRAGDDLPAGWHETLDAAVAGERRRATLGSPLWVAAASFLAGAALSWSVSRPPAAPTAVGEPVVLLDGTGAFERASPPPRARDRGTLPLLELYLRR